MQWNQIQSETLRANTTANTTTTRQSQSSLKKAVLYCPVRVLKNVILKTIESHD